VTSAALNILSPHLLVCRNQVDLKVWNAPAWAELTPFVLTG